MQLTIGGWDKNGAGSSDMNFQGPISQRHLLYVGYTYLEWRLAPLGLNTRTTHSCCTADETHSIFYGTHAFYLLSPAALFPFPPPFSLCSFCFHATPPFYSCTFFFFSREGKGSQSLPIFLHISSYKILLNVFALQHLLLNVLF